MPCSVLRSVPLQTRQRTVDEVAGQFGGTKQHKKHEDKSEGSNRQVLSVALLLSVAHSCPRAPCAVLHLRYKPTGPTTNVKANLDSHHHTLLSFEVLKLFCCTQRRLSSLYGIRFDFSDKCHLSWQPVSYARLSTESRDSKFKTRREMCCKLMTTLFLCFVFNWKCG